MNDFFCLLLVNCLLTLAQSKPSVLSEDAMVAETLKRVQFQERLNQFGTSIGQIGGLDTDAEGNLVVFHRASRKWERDSFHQNKFNVEKYGPIEQDVLSLIDAEKMSVIESWGKNRFYMPHGLTIDSEENVWLTDVALHQVFKYNFKVSDKPLLTIGERFVSSDDFAHFCKPAAVATSLINGDIFVADGYCNSRLVQLDKHGKYIRELKDETIPMQVVHSLALIEDKSLVCAVSREDGRIVCFDLDTGAKKITITDEKMSTVYAIAYDPINEVLHAVTGSNNDQESYGLTFDAGLENFGDLLNVWQPNYGDLSDAHALTISPDMASIFVGQLNGEIDTFSFE